MRLKSWFGASPSPSASSTSPVERRTGSTNASTMRRRVSDVAPVSEPARRADETAEQVSAAIIAARKQLAAADRKYKSYAKVQAQHG